MTAQFARAGYQSRPSSPIQHNPQAALLIDFDNVTMGIRSDLSKELKNLLNSDIIKGKVAVQRAYADWRRYPQYIVPLAEASVDLIFAPAYGSSKKNATDIRLAIDALELVFTRGEIGTFILLSGDSDFSSLVLKLKEYGKYVIGVGIRESASDLLVQNCDEYYSYNALTGLTKTTDEMPMGANDPWELVDIAVRQMADGSDVMRSDRLKQVLVELDPNFDEKTLGFSKFNRFLQEAAKRGLLMLQKMENGQYEVAVPSAEQAQAKADARAEEDRGEGRRSRRGGRGRGRRDGGRDSRRDEERVTTPEPAPAGSAVAAPPAPATSMQDLRDQPDVAATQDVEPAEAAAASAGREASEPRVAPRPTTERPAGAASAPAPGLNGAYVLLRRAVKDAARNGVARDSDVKRRMLEVEPDFDEASFGFSKFSRFLRQAHEDRVVDVQKIENGGYDVMLGEGEPVVVDRDEQEERGRRGRGRRGEGRERKPARETADASAPAGSADKPRERAVEAPREAPAAPAVAAAAPPAAAAAASTAAPASNVAAAQPPARPLGMRRGSRGRPAPSGPPPLLEGQAVGPATPAPRSESAAAAAPPHVESPQKDDVVSADAAEQPKAPPEKRSGRERARKDRGAAKRAGSAPTAGKPPRAATPARKQPSTQRGLDVAALGLPSQPVEVVSYLATNYKGIGQKMAESLVEAFGGTGVFEGLQRNPDRVKDILGAKRGEKLLEAWYDDYAFRLANQTDPAQARKEPAARAGRSTGRPSGPRREGGGEGARKGGGEGARKGGGRTRRGGRKRPGPKKTG